MAITDPIRPGGPAAALVRDLAGDLGVEPERVARALDARGLLVVSIGPERTQWPSAMHDLYITGALDGECVLLGRSGMAHAMRRLHDSGVACGVSAWHDSDTARLLDELVSGAPLAAGSPRTRPG